MGFGLFDRISKEQILERISEKEIYEHYLGNDIIFNASFNSPLREDKNPSFAIRIFKDGTIRWKDFSTGESGSVFDLVMRMFNISFKESLLKIAKDLNILDYGRAYSNNNTNYISNTSQSIIWEKERLVRVKVQEYTEVDLEYWKRYYIDSDLLKLYHIYSCHTVFYDSRPWLYYKDSNPIFGYLFYKDDKYSWKIYRPLSEFKKDRFRGSVDDSILQGYQQLPRSGDSIIITKSLKDVVVLRRLGYNAIAPQSEHSVIKPQVYLELKERFKDVYILFDNDPTGVCGSARYKEVYNSNVLLLEESKDISDYIKSFGLEQTQMKLKGLL